MKFTCFQITALTPYRRAGIVTLVDWPAFLGGSMKNNGAQRVMLNHALHGFGVAGSPQLGWLGSLDPDEYILVSPELLLRNSHDGDEDDESVRIRPGPLPGAPPQIEADVSISPLLAAFAKVGPGNGTAVRIPRFLAKPGTPNIHEVVAGGSAAGAYRPRAGRNCESPSHLVVFEASRRRGPSRNNLGCNEKKLTCSHTN